MTPTDKLARRRYFAMTATRIAGAAGAVFGVFLAFKSHGLPVKILGIAIVLSALLMIATVPRSLARRWRTPPQR